MTTYLKCRSSKGQFSDERCVEFRDAKGVGRSMFVPGCHVHGADDNSLMEIQIGNRANELALVWLPAPMLEAAGGGNTVTVLDSQIVYPTETVYDV